MIYAYITDYEGTKNAIKIGYTKRDVKGRVHAQCSQVGVNYTILNSWDAKKRNGKDIMDKQVHRLLEERGFKKCVSGSATEWFYCELKDVENAVRDIVVGALK